MSALRLFASVVVVAGSVLLLEGTDAHAFPPSCSLCYGYCPAQAEGDNACFGVCGSGYTMTACIESPLCANPAQIEIVCLGEPE